MRASLRSSKRRLHRLLRLSWAERLLLIEASFWLGLARLAILALPFRWIAPRLGRHVAGAAPAGAPGQADRLRRIAWAVTAASRHTPWKSACLAQAIAAKVMLRLRGLPSTLYLGVAKDGDGGLDAHAWLRSGDLILTGERGRERFPDDPHMNSFDNWRRFEHHYVGSGQLFDLWMQKPAEGE